MLMISFCMIMDSDETKLILLVNMIKRSLDPYVKEATATHWSNFSISQPKNGNITLKMS